MRVFALSPGDGAAQAEEGGRFGDGAGDDQVIDAERVGAGTRADHAEGLRGAEGSRVGAGWNLASAPDSVMVVRIGKG